MDNKKLAGILHSAGIDAYTHPQSQSGEEWDSYRIKIARRLLSRLDIQEKVAVSPVYENPELRVSSVSQKNTDK